MSLNIIDFIKGQLGPDLILQASSQLGESEAGVSKAISGLLPVVVGGLANNAENPAVLDTISNASSSGILERLQDINSNSAIITGILSSIFGDKLNGIINSIATYAGVSNHSASSLLNTVSATTVGAIGKYATEHNLDKAGISSLLNEQKSTVSELLPAGLSLASLNVDDWAKGYDFEGRQEAALPTAAEEAPKPEVTRSIAEEGTFPNKTNNSDGGSFWKWLLPLLLLLVAGYFLWKQCKTSETTTTTTVTGDSMRVTEDSVMGGSTTP